MAEVQGSLVRREVPLSVVRAADANEALSLQDLVVVHRTLCLEERNAYQAAVIKASDGAEGGRYTSPSSLGDALTPLHHANAYQQSLCNLMATALVPALTSMSSLRWQNEVQQRQLRRQNEEIQVMEGPGQQR